MITYNFKSFQLSHRWQNAQCGSSMADEDEVWAADEDNVYQTTYDHQKQNRRRSKKNNRRKRKQKMGGFRSEEDEDMPMEIGMPLYFGSCSLMQLEANREYQVTMKTRNKLGWTDDETGFTFTTSRNSK